MRLTTEQFFNQKLDRNVGGVCHRRMAIAKIKTVMGHALLALKDTGAQLVLFRWQTNKVLAAPSLWVIGEDWSWVDGSGICGQERATHGGRGHTAQIRQALMSPPSKDHISMFAALDTLLSSYNDKVEVSNRNTAHRMGGARQHVTKIDTVGWHLPSDSIRGGRTWEPPQKRQQRLQAVAAGTPAPGL